MKNALLIVSHGSRRAASNDEVTELTARIRELTTGHAEHAFRIQKRVIDTGSLDTEKPVLQNAAAATGLTVECAFLEITEPTVQQAIDQLAETGVTDIQIFPHFLAAGTHVTRDIPREIETAQKRHPAINFSQMPHLGSLPGLGALVRNLLDSTGNKNAGQQ